MRMALFTTCMMAVRRVVDKFRFIYEIIKSREEITSSLDLLLYDYSPNSRAIILYDCSVYAIELFYLLDLKYFLQSSMSKTANRRAPVP